MQGPNEIASVLGDLPGSVAVPSPAPPPSTSPSTSPTSELPPPRPSAAPPPYSSASLPRLPAELPAELPALPSGERRAAPRRAGDLSAFTRFLLLFLKESRFLMQRTKT